MGLLPRSPGGSKLEKKLNGRHRKERGDGEAGVEKGIEFGPLRNPGHATD